MLYALHRTGLSAAQHLVDCVQVKRVSAKFAAGAAAAEVVLVSPAICTAMLGASHREAHSMAQDLDIFAEDKWDKRLLLLMLLLPLRWSLKPLQTFMSLVTQHELVGVHNSMYSTECANEYSQCHR